VGWFVIVTANEIASEITLNTNAACFDNPPAHIPSSSTGQNILWCFLNLSKILLLI
jgi:hypothetical protein